MSDSPSQQPPVLNYGNPNDSGPTTFDRFMGSLCFVMSGTCVLGSGVVVALVVARYHLNRPAVLFGLAGMALVMGMGYALYRAGCAIGRFERRQS